MTHHCLLRSENLFFAIKIYVVVSWMDWILSLGRCFSRGAVNRFIFVSILKQQYFW